MSASGFISETTEAADPTGRTVCVRALARYKTSIFAFSSAFTLNTESEGGKHSQPTEDYSVVTVQTAA